MFFILALIFLWPQTNAQTAGPDNAAVSENAIKAVSANRVLVTHVVYYNGSGTKEDRESASLSLEREVAKDKKAYEQCGFHVDTISHAGQTAMATRLLQIDHLEIQPPKIQPRE